MYGQKHIKIERRISMNKLLKLGLAFSIILSTLLGSSIYTSADSGASALPSKDSALHQYYYKLYAPKTQTTFKKLSTATQAISSIKQQNKKLIFYGSVISGGGAFAGLFQTVKNAPYVGTGVRIVSGVGGAMYLVGTYGQVKYDSFKKGSQVKHQLYFKWTNAAKLEYQVKIESWVEYKGKKVSSVKTRYFSKTI